MALLPAIQGAIHKLVTIDEQTRVFYTFQAHTNGRVLLEELVVEQRPDATAQIWKLAKFWRWPCAAGTEKWLEEFLPSVELTEEVLREARERICYVGVRN